MRSTVARLVALALLAGCTYDGHEPTGPSRVLVAALIHACSVEANGELASPDPATFSGSAIVYTDGVAEGSWTHRVLVGTVMCAEDEDCPGNGQKRGHETGKGLGHDIGNGKGHCEHASSTCTEAPVYDEFIGTVDAGTCSINGHQEVDLFGTGTWNGAPVTFGLVAGDATLLGDFYTLTVSDGAGVVYSVSGDISSGDIVVMGL